MSAWENAAPAACGHGDRRPCHALLDYEHSSSASHKSNGRSQGGPSGSGILSSIGPAEGRFSSSIGSTLPIQKYSSTKPHRTSLANRSRCCPASRFSLRRLYGVTSATSRITAADSARFESADLAIWRRRAMFLVLMCDCLRKLRTSRSASNSAARLHAAAAHVTPMPFRGKGLVGPHRLADPAVVAHPVYCVGRRRAS